MRGGPQRRAACRIGDTRLTSVDDPVPVDGTALLLRAGKKRFIRVLLTD